MVYKEKKTIIVLVTEASHLMHERQFYSNQPSGREKLSAAFNIFIKLKNLLTKSILRDMMYYVMGGIVWIFN